MSRQTAARHSDQAVLLLRSLEGGALERSLLETENKSLLQKLEESIKDLERERAAGAKLKSDKAAADASIKQMRAKIKELEDAQAARAAEESAKLKEQMAQVHVLKEKMRARNVVLEQRGKELEAALAR